MNNKIKKIFSIDPATVDVIANAGQLIHKKHSGTLDYIVRDWAELKSKRVQRTDSDTLYDDIRHIKGLFRSNGRSFKLA